MTILDALIVGAGPAGLTAAVYLGRYRRDVLLVDAGRSRARWIPISRNTPGFPGGIHGETLLDEMREQAARFGVAPRLGKVEALRREGDHFVANLAGEAVHAARVILATGVVDALPEMDGAEAAIHAGVLRLCPICDGFEADGRRVAVYGPADKVAGHARFLRSFSGEVAAVVSRGTLGEDERAQLAALDIAVIDDADSLVWNGERDLCVLRKDGEAERFDVLYPVLGVSAQSQLAVAIGAECTREGELVVDAHQRTSVPGLYAIGDVVSALNQISVGVGHAAVAATDLHNSLPHKPR